MRAGCWSGGRRACSSFPAAVAGRWTGSRALGCVQPLAGQVCIRPYSTPAVRLFHPRCVPSPLCLLVSLTQVADGVAPLVVVVGREKIVKEAKLPPFIRARE